MFDQTFYFDPFTFCVMIKHGFIKIFFDQATFDGSFV